MKRCLLGGFERQNWTCPEGKNEKSLPNFVLGAQSQNFRSVSNLSRYQKNAWRGALIGDQFSQRRSFVDTNVHTQRKSAPRDPEEEHQQELSTLVSVSYLVPIWFDSGWACIPV